jgi:hypothetical protein
MAHVYGDDVCLRAGGLAPGSRNGAFDRSKPTVLKGTVVERVENLG